MGIMRLKYNPTNGAWMQESDGMPAGGTNDFILIVSNQPAFKLNFFCDFIDGYYNKNGLTLTADQVNQCWLLYDYGFKMGESQESLANFSDN